jgi:hypothetical protein
MAERGSSHGNTVFFLGGIWFGKVVVHGRLTGFQDESSFHDIPLFNASMLLLDACILHVSTVTERA